MVHRLVVSYGQPDDPEAFDAYYRDTHTPLATKMPGLVRYTLGSPQALDPSQPPPDLVAELDSEQAMGAAFASEEGKAAAGDVANVATGGATMIHYEVREVPVSR